MIVPFADCTISGYVTFNGPGINVKVGNLVAPVYLRSNNGYATDLYGKLQEKSTTVERRGFNDTVYYMPKERAEAIRVLSRQLWDESHAENGRLTRRKQQQ